MQSHEFCKENSLWKSTSCLPEDQTLIINHKTKSFRESFAFKKCVRQELICVQLWNLLLVLATNFKLKIAATLICFISNSLFRLKLSKFVARIFWIRFPSAHKNTLFLEDYFCILVHSFGDVACQMEDKKAQLFQNLTNFKKKFPKYKANVLIVKEVWLSCLNFRDCSRNFCENNLVLASSLEYELSWQMFLYGVETFFSF